MQVGTTKDQGLYNKPSAAVHPGALAAGTLPQYQRNTLLAEPRDLKPLLDRALNQFHPPSIFTAYVYYEAYQCYPSTFFSVFCMEFSKTFP